MPPLKKIFAVVALLLSPAVCRADAANLVQAEKLFQSGAWEQARQAYKAELAASADPAALPPAFFYDYGTALARAGAPAEAYVALLHAAFAQPFDADTRHNLRLVSAQVPATASAVQPASWLSWWPAGLRILPWTLWLAAALFCSAAALLLTHSPDRAAPAGAGIVALVLLVWTGLAWEQNRQPIYGAIAAAKVKSGPGPSFSDILTLEAGSLVSEELARDGWLKVRFFRPGVEDETVGWVEPSAVLRVR